MNWKQNVEDQKSERNRNTKNKQKVDSKKFVFDLIVKMWRWKLVQSFYFFAVETGNCVDKKFQ
jgi:hypothetical protein